MPNADTITNIDVGDDPTTSISTGIVFNCDYKSQVMNYNIFYLETMSNLDGVLINTVS
jgi:hypothetical protein